MFSDEIDWTGMDSKIVPLVQVINQIGLTTFYSCEGHGENRSIVQSPSPQVAFRCGDSDHDACLMYRFLEMIGIHNESCRSPLTDVKWVVLPLGTDHFQIKPLNDSLDLDTLHEGIVVLANDLQKIKTRYENCQKRRC